MQPFRFRLDRVLQWRRNKRQLEEARLASCLALAQASEREMERLRAERDSIDRGMLRRDAIPASDFLDLSRYRIRAQKEEMELAEERRQRLLMAAEQRVRVLQAQRGVKLLEKMKERRLQEHTALAWQEVEEAAAAAFLSRWSQARARQQSDAGLEHSASPGE
jgi:hypothetical protein